VCSAVQAFIFLMLWGSLTRISVSLAVRITSGGLDFIFHFPTVRPTTLAFLVKCDDAM
jgi:hypothetical protein